MGISKHYASLATFFFVDRVHPSGVTGETQRALQGIAERYIPFVMALNKVAPPQKKTGVPFRLIAVLDDRHQFHNCYIGRVSREELMEHDETLRKHNALASEITEKCHESQFLDRLIRVEPNDQRIEKELHTGLYNKFLKGFPVVSPMAFRQAVEEARLKFVPYKPEPRQKARTVNPELKAG